MKTLPRYTLILIAAVLVFSCAVSAWSNTDVPLVTKEELKAMLDDPEVIVLDVRRRGDWQSSEYKIKGAVYADPSDYSAWAKTYPKDKTLVLYCA
jgi:rhodanese-related sulfurtransferase